MEVIGLKVRLEDNTLVELSNATESVLSKLGPDTREQLIEILEGMAPAPKLFSGDFADLPGLDDEMLDSAEIDRPLMVPEGLLNDISTLEATLDKLKALVEC